ncbi:unnamed protein product [Spirodela intermedia]|uniref:Uncharacterized protein n=1 Tax=Spirodela intermedia TaxID=51605 RepID=A0A7I8JJ79_SPIIN|nr:unnamed protein product [Spirodela intermedia]CAA6670228.1 unnamed protein product [Spirodela intermedia]
MPDPIPACFRGGAAAAPPGSATAGPSVTTSIYETPLGLAALTWSRTVLGLSSASSSASPSPLPAGAPPPPSGSVSGRGSSGSGEARRGSTATGRVLVGLDAGPLPRRRRPRALQRVLCRRGGQRRDVPGGGGHGGGGLQEEQSSEGRAGRAVLLSRREHVGELRGKEREILIDLGSSAAAGEKEAKLWVAVDGKKVIQVKRLRWKFRGNEKVAVDGGGKVQVSWDVHSWLFNREPIDVAAAAGAAAPPTAAPEFGHASFMFRFEMEEADEGGGGSGIDHSSGSIGSGGVVALAGKKKKSLLKTSSSSSSSSASSGSSSSVAEWASAEESELRGSGGFSLLVCVWKN